MESLFVLIYQVILIYEWKSIGFISENEEEEYQFSKLFSVSNNHINIEALCVSLARLPSSTSENQTISLHSYHFCLIFRYTNVSLSLHLSGEIESWLRIYQSFNGDYGKWAEFCKTPQIVW
ncbi:CLUMA_CG008343, isoform A [Clunio marinus]|uniref:CLUMA_CG008343, isoform A n=1 Tax=Clunio marinus TaxID=568069 RepID=A0A1J1I3S7_9DIPT|nr:CLUMA_CG008343, isoform A [Clunio marinus]